MFADFEANLPFVELLSSKGNLNLASNFKYSNLPDLGPKIYISYRATGDTYCTTNLHLDASDAVNLLVFSSGSNNDTSAIWDLYYPTDLDTLRTEISSWKQRTKKATDEIVDEADVIHSQATYLSKADRKNLFDRHGIRSIRMHQKQGDLVYIPSGFAHQVYNTENCIKIAVDFLSPFNAWEWLSVREDIRRLPKDHPRKKDLTRGNEMVFHTLEKLKIGY